MNARDMSKVHIVKNPCATIATTKVQNIKPKDLEEGERLFQS